MWAKTGPDLQWSKDPPDRLRHMPDIWDDHRGSGRHRIGCRAVCRRGLPIPLYRLCGIPIAVGAWVMCLFSGSLPGIDMQILSAWVRSVQATAILCTRGWWESKSKYLSVWVFFLNTDMVKDPSMVSRNGSIPSISVSMVNWMVGSIEFRLSWNN